MLKWRASVILLFAAIAATLAFILARNPDSALSRAELATRDQIAQSGRRAPENTKLVYLAIDSESISLDAKTDLKGLFGIQDKTTPEGRALNLMSQHWPWPRSVYSLVLDRLIGAGAKVVVFDLLFATPNEYDDDFRAALDRYRDRVVIGSNFISPETSDEGPISASLTLPSATLIPQERGPDSRVGYVNFWPEVDGVIRNAQFQTNFSQFIGSSAQIGEADLSSLAAQVVRKFGRGEVVPTDTLSRSFRFTEGARVAFPPRSIFEIFVPEYWQQNFKSGAVFDGAIVMIGAAGNWQHDEHRTPMGIMSGAEIQLNVVNALLNRDFLRPLSPWLSALVWILATGIAAGASIWCTKPVRRIVLFLVIVGAWIGVQFPLFNDFGIFAPVVGPIAILLFVGFASLVFDLICAGAEQLRLRLALIERKRAQEVLETANEELERRVAERTVELTRANTDLTRLIEEKDVLLKEIHHRVKNNLQVISSLLNLQSNHIEDPVALQIFTESRNRVRSMALIHEKLYQSADLSRIDFQDYVKALTAGLHASFAGQSSAVRISADVEPIMLSVDSAVPCGLILNELVTNCFKYAFREAGKGEIQISLKRTEPSRLCLTVSDDGVGFPKNIDFRNTESLGMQLITTLTDQLDGTISLRNGCGTTFEIAFPETSEAQP